MAKEQSASWGSFVHEWFQLGVYKPSQGRIVRQATFVVLASIVWMGCYQLRNQLRESYEQWQLALPVALVVAGTWLAFRLVNYPRFADFLIAVEGELNKVSFPSKDEVIRSTIVVIMVIFILAALIFGFDLCWRQIFEWIGVVRN
jgi:preprotein translocase subunit SecE